MTSINLEVTGKSKSTAVKDQFSFLDSVFRISKVRFNTIFIFLQGAVLDS